MRSTVIWLVLLVAALLSAGGGYNRGGYHVGSGFVASTPTIMAREFQFIGESLTRVAYFSTNPAKGGTSIILSGPGRIKLRLLDRSDSTYAFSSWSTYFTNSGNLGSVCSIVGLALGRIYDADYYVDPQNGDNFDPSGWQRFASFNLSDGDKQVDWVNY